MITLTYCYVCPHRCGVDRPENMNDTSYDKYFGSCGCGMLPIVARAGLHMWEEPCISGTKGSGTVFFSGCNLHCVFCQNFDISCKGFGKEISIERLQEIYQELIAQGAHNINLVT
ncbi:MAG: 4Fe-4S cluster-binding domain-containing protein, partial [Phascolarctobacterium sp.]|nr:4Fe-4S cluster-binding domain-containing protein [Phascolarctobacterium sp.]